MRCGRLRQYHPCTTSLSADLSISAEACYASDSDEGIPTHQLSQPSRVQTRIGKERQRGTETGRVRKGEGEREWGGEGGEEEGNAVGREERERLGGRRGEREGAD